MVSIVLPFVGECKDIGVRLRTVRIEEDGILVGNRSAISLKVGDKATDVTLCLVWRLIFPVVGAEGDTLLKPYASWAGGAPTATRSKCAPD